MRWWLVPAAASLPLLAIACSDSSADTTKTSPAEKPATSRPAAAPKSDGKQSETRTLVLTYFTIPG